MISQTLDSNTISKIIKSLQEAQQMLSVIQETNSLENTILTSSPESPMDDEEFTTMNIVDDISFQSSQEDTNENILFSSQTEDLTKAGFDVANDNATAETDKTSNTTTKIVAKKRRLSPKKWRRMSRNHRLRSVLLF